MEHEVEFEEGGAGVHYEGLEERGAGTVGGEEAGEECEEAKLVGCVRMGGGMVRERMVGCGM